MKPTCVAYTNKNEYIIQTCGFHQTFKNKLYSDEKLFLFTCHYYFADWLSK